MSQKNEKIFAFSIMAAGMIVSSVILAYGVHNMRGGDRFVTVKGVAEREVKANLAVWPLKTKVSGDDLVATQAALQRNVDTIVTFLKSNGVTEEEISLQGLRVVDRLANEYGAAQPGQMRYIIETTVMLRTTDVDKVSKISQQMSNLVKAGVTLSEDNTCSGGASYSFTTLNEIKPEMLAEATKSAREAAQQFANDSGSSVGQIRQAYQGVFSINSRDQMSEGGEGGNCNPSDINKKVRVVTTLDYYLEQ